MKLSQSLRAINDTNSVCRSIRVLYSEFNLLIGHEYTVLLYSGVMTITCAYGAQRSQLPESVR